MGFPPKTIARLVRFNRAVRSLDRLQRDASQRAGGQAVHRDQATGDPPVGAIQWAELAADCGYADQAHLIRDFLEFAGMTPDAFLRSVSFLTLKVPTRSKKYNTGALVLAIDPGRNEEPRRDAVPADQPGRDRRADSLPHRRITGVVVGRAGRLEDEGPRADRVGDSFSAQRGHSRAGSLLRPRGRGQSHPAAYPNAQIDSIDRDPFLTSICRAVNQRDRIPGTLVVKDLKADGWLDELSGNYDIVATVNALHWFEVERAAQIVEDVHGALRGGGLFLLAEPACPETPFAAGFEQWKANAASALHARELGAVLVEGQRAARLRPHDAPGPAEANRIGDGMSVAGWIRLLERAGFELIDVLLRDADQVVIGAVAHA